MNGPTHYSINQPHRPLGRQLLRQALLQRQGLSVVHVPFYTWQGLRNPQARRRWLQEQVNAAPHSSLLDATYEDRTTSMQRSSGAGDNIDFDDFPGQGRGRGRGNNPRFGLLTSSSGDGRVSDDAAVTHPDRIVDSTVAEVYRGSSANKNGSSRLGAHHHDNAGRPGPKGHRPNPASRKQGKSALRRRGRLKDRDRLEDFESEPGLLFDAETTAPAAGAGQQHATWPQYVNADNDDRSEFVI